MDIRWQINYQNQVMNRSKDKKDISIILPTYNEAENIEIAINKIYQVLGDRNFEIIVVDDNSPDKTWEIVEKLKTSKDKVKLIRRFEDKGLSTAIFAGMLEAEGSVILVMDSDLQHDEKIIPPLIESIKRDKFEVSIGSRDTEEGGYGDLSTKRKITSFIGRWFAHKFLKVNINDPMSGFFAISKSFFEEVKDHVNPSGFKILIEFIVRKRTPRVKEIGYKFKRRLYGDIKLNPVIIIEFFLKLIDLRFGWLIPNRFVKFSIVGLSGSLINFFSFSIASILGLKVLPSVYLGAQIGIFWSYSLNNFFTFSNLRYRGFSFFKGLILYQVVSVIGIVIQLSIVQSIITTWEFMAESLTTLYFSYLISVCFAALVNYYIHTNYTWNKLGFTLVKPMKIDRNLI